MPAELRLLAHDAHRDGGGGAGFAEIKGDTLHGTRREERKGREGLFVCLCVCNRGSTS